LCWKLLPRTCVVRSRCDFQKTKTKNFFFLFLLFRFLFERKNISLVVIHNPDIVQYMSICEQLLFQ
jgi:hypothetical protein